MPSGIKSLTTISFMLITTESSSNALTASNEGFIQGFLRTLLITQKSKSAFVLTFTNMLIIITEFCWPPFGTKVHVHALDALLPSQSWMASVFVEIFPFA